jgi:monoamine oxidase
MSSGSIIIIGAGAAGLQAGRILSRAGRRVTILEAAAEPGGRIHTIMPPGFSGPLEGGAEFIHGELPLSIALAKEAGIVLQPVKAQMTHAGDGRQQEGSGQDWGRLMQEMEALKTDMTIADFLSVHFGGERYANLRESVRRFAEGYDLADLRRVSTRSLHREWSKEEDEEEYRLVGGYRQMTDFLAAECRRQGAALHCSSPVTEVSWKKGQVEVTTAKGDVFTAGGLIVSASLGVLETGGLRFNPSLPGMKETLSQLGYGSVIKIILEFKTRFWLKKKQKGQTLFLLSEEEVPTWWTQAEEESPLLTGWLAGERMERFRRLDEPGRLDSCLRSLGSIFSLEPAALRGELVASLVLDWSSAPFVRGGYSYDTLRSAEARTGLSRPVADTIWFCGEGIYEGDAPGTVEAALCSGQEVAEKLVRSLQAD